MTRTTLLRNTPDWELSRPDWAIYDHFFYTDTGHVRKVEGLVENIHHSGNICGERAEVKGYVEVRWDGFGCCWSVPGNVRKKQYDIRFD